MAITSPVLALNEFNVANLGTYDTGAVVLTAGRRYFLSVHSYKATAAATVTSVTHNPLGTPLAFALATDGTTPAGVTYATLYRLETWHVDVGTTTASALIRIVLSATASAAGWILWYIDGEDNTGTIVKVVVATGTGTSSLVTMNTFGATDNLAVLYSAVTGNLQNITVAESRVELAECDETERQNSALHYRNPHSSDTTLTASWTTSLAWAAIGIEVKAGVTSTQYPYTGTGGGAFAGTALSSRVRAAPIATNGLVSGGTAPAPRQRVTVTTGGLVSGGAAVTLQTRSYSYTPTGGLASGGASLTLRRRSTVGAGGLIAAGVATLRRTIAIVAAGGLITAGVAPASHRTVAPAPTGGITVSGTAPAPRKRVTLPTGGAVFGGTAPSSKVGIQSYQYVGTGGGIFAGAAPVLFTKVQIGTGGLLASGAAPSLRKRSAFPTGGIVAAGTALVPRKRSTIGNGGGVFGGTAPSSKTGGAVSYPYTGTGGATFAGTAPTAYRRARVGSGGLTSAGAAPSSRARRMVPTGGVVISGTATPVRSRATIGSGGLVAGGAVRPGWRRVVAVSGGATFGGTAPSNLVIIPLIPPATYISVATSATEVSLAGSRSKLEPVPSISDLVLSPSESTLKMSTHSMVAGDTIPPIIATLSWPASISAVHPDLTDAASVTFRMEKISDNSVILNLSPAEFLDRVARIVRYPWLAALVAGQYRGKFRVVFNNGDVLSVPTRNYLTINVELP